MTTYTPTQLKNLLTNLPRGVRLEVIKTASGEIAVSGKPSKDDLIKQKYGHLVGKSITINDAAKKYNLHRNTIQDWRYKGYLRVLKPGYRMEINEADVAYCAEIYHERKKTGIGFRAPLLDENGLPYQLKHPKLSEYRKRRKQND